MSFFSSRLALGLRIRDSSTKTELIEEEVENVSHLRTNNLKEEKLDRFPPRLESASFSRSAEMKLRFLERFSRIITCKRSAVDG